MKIVEQTPTQLSLEFSPAPWVVFYILFGLPFLLGGLFVNAAIGRYTTLACQRAAPQQPVTCEIRKLSILGQEVIEVPAKPQKAVVKPAPSGKNIYTVVLVSAQSSVQITPEGAERGDSQRSAHAINQFLQDRSKTRFQTSQATFGLAIGSIFTLAGSGIILLFLTYPLPYYCSFDQITGQLLIKKWSVLLGKRQLTRPLNEIQEILTEGRTQRGQKSYQLGILMQNGEKLTLSENNPFGKAQIEAMAQRINEFLH